MCGDPGRALRLAQALCAQTPRMLNHHRGLWGYSGTALDGAPLTVQGLGLGGPSASLVVADLAALGARRLVRIGTCRAPHLAPGTLVLPAPPDAALAAALPEAVAGPVTSIDPGDPAPAGIHDFATAATLAAARRHGIAAAAVLIVDAPDEVLHPAEEAAGRAALAALAG